MIDNIVTFVLLIQINIFILGDFKTIIGENIPYRKLGYQSLEAFLKSISDIKISNKGGQIYVEALPNEKSYHLSKLIAQQKSSNKKEVTFILCMIHV